MYHLILNKKKLNVELLNDQLYLKNNVFVDLILLLNDLFDKNLILNYHWYSVDSKKKKEREEILLKIINY